LYNDSKYKPFSLRAYWLSTSTTSEPQTCKVDDYASIVAHFLVIEDIL